MIRILSPEELTRDFALNNLVIVGGAAWLELRKSTPWLARGTTLPFATPWLAQDVAPPTAKPTGETHIFECSVGDERQEFSSLRVGEGLAQDVGLIARVPHPLITARTVILLSGITSRGVHGATLCFTDPNVRGDNERYLTERFGNVHEFCVMMNVLIANNAALPPNLSLENACLWTWSPRREPAGEVWSLSPGFTQHATAEFCTWLLTPHDPMPLSQS